MVYDHEKVPQIYLWWAKFVENYRVFTGNIGKGCMRSQEVNNKIPPCMRKSRQQKKKNLIELVVFY